VHECEGKLEVGETPEDALVRELREELRIEIDVGTLKPMCFASHSYATFHLLMPLYGCVDGWSGSPCGAEGQNLVWSTHEELETYSMPPADYPLLDAVKHAMTLSVVQRD